MYLVLVQVNAAGEARAQDLPAGEKAARTTFSGTL